MNVKWRSLNGLGCHCTAKEGWRKMLGLSTHGPMVWLPGRDCDRCVAIAHAVCNVHTVQCLSLATYSDLKLLVAMMARARAVARSCCCNVGACCRFTTTSLPVPVAIRFPIGAAWTMNPFL